MSNLRKDPIVDRWVIIASERSKRPNEYGSTHESPSAEYCPFCRGNEEATPASIREYCDETGRWNVRVVPNKFPALAAEGSPEEANDGIYEALTAVGVHEVIIESGDHRCDLAELTVDELEVVLGAWRDRLVSLRDDPRLKCAMVFKNHGAQAGASVAHAHSQLIGLPLVPRQLREELAGTAMYRTVHGTNVFDDIVAQELDSGARLVYENDDIVVIAPFASRSPFELTLLPRRNEPWYENDEEATYRSLADALSVVCNKLNRALEKPPYNLVLHSAPYTNEDMSHFRWHLELIPTLTKVAGFEWGAGYHVNPVRPEDAARHLREIIV